MSVIVIFSRSRTLGSAAIRRGTFSDWSHCGLYDPETATVIESTWPAGVVETPLSEFVTRRRIDAWAYREFEHWDAATVLGRARSQIGKPYDKTAILGFVANRDWQEDDSWFCSELIAWAAVEYLPFTPELMHRITPQYVWALRGVAHV